ncbi:GntR family phosphonate transport system transcriptional regulator [Bradyrhizobium sp. CIR48]|uniref:phosphonate metabolism transcriptional regulator PhnF n=1 Tax=Bradyrhizobium sp. CIR48 TaxID=2663840 RepID=UPI0016069419|nr:phosphonate metabolism transcriptional regulator PhnF [Bradyrhizobium sp. CIR48]MBB4428313.1 GntR family phosphonate transport system transcriptional regulator [Bradyrhizobium sp. CIR48]
MSQSSSGLPLWRQVQFALEEEIGRGVIQPGQRLPAEEALADRFGMHRQTIRRAISRLQEKGIVRAEQGRGTFVQEQVVIHRLARRSRVGQTSERMGLKPIRQVIEAKRVRANRIVAQGLGVPVGIIVQRVETLRFINDRPVSVTSHFYPLPRFDGIAKSIQESGSVTKALVAFGVADFTHVWTTISAKIPSQRDAKLLGQPVSRPILRTINASVDEAGKPVQFTEARFAARLIELTIRYDPARD